MADMAAFVEQVASFYLLARVCCEPGLRPPLPHAILRKHASQLQCKEEIMKTATIPSLRVEPELREAAEDLLKEGETLSSFVEQALRTQIKRRTIQRDFIARAVKSLEESERTGEFFTIEDVMSDMDEILAEAETKAAK
jgi:predicted transcriptional regulator